jgi:TRAP-type mannitol/chloroaromatic compound transport system permease large subunit
VALCAWVMDAFEMIFVVIPILAPVLVLRLGDAAQASVLLLWVLQLGFLIPPMGYAVLMARKPYGAALRNGDIWRALWPYAAVQLLLGSLILMFPALVHQLDAPKEAISAPQGSIEQNASDIARQIEEMAKQGEEKDKAAEEPLARLPAKK